MRMLLGKKWISGLIFYTVIFALAGMMACKSRSQKAMDEFNTVNDSLQATTLPADSMRLLHMHILARQQVNPQLALMADSVFVITSYAISYMDSLKQVLISLDSTGETSVATNKVFGSESASKLLYRDLLQVHYYTGKAIITKSKLARVNYFFAFEADMPDDKTFVRKFFNNNLDVVSLTILSKFQNDCRSAAILALTDINEAITKTR